MAIVHFFLLILIWIFKKSISYNEDKALCQIICGSGGFIHATLPNFNQLLVIDLDATHLVLKIDLVRPDFIALKNKKLYVTISYRMFNR